MVQKVMASVSARRNKREKKRANVGCVCICIGVPVMTSLWISTVGTRKTNFFYRKTKEYDYKSVQASFRS